MGVAPVPGYGMITSSNAADIYKDKTTYDQLDPAQKHLVDRYVPQDTRDEIDYEMGRGTQNAYEMGNESINTEGTEGSSKATAGTAAGASVAAAGGTILGVALGAKLGMDTKVYLKSGFLSLALSIPMAVVSALALTLSFPGTFDTSHSDRAARNDESGQTNETMSAHVEALENTMASMDEDVAAYQDQQELLTTTTNNNASTGADLQAQIMDAEAAGDADRLASLKEQLKAVGEFDYSQMEGDLDETRANLEGYNECNAMAMGVRDAGTSVSEFLKEGHTLGTLATVSAVALTAATGLLAVATVLGAIPKLWAGPIPIDGGAATASAVLWSASTIMMGYAAKNMYSNANEQREFGKHGDEMADYVNNLSGMIGEQQSYIDQTTEDFDASDEVAAELVAEGEKNAAEVVANASENYRQEKPDNNKNGNEEGAGNGSNNNQNS